MATNKVKMNQSENLRIAVVVGTFPTVSETFIVNQLNALKEQGHEVVLFAYEKGRVKHLHASIIQNQWHKNVHYANRVPKSYFKRLRYVNWYLLQHWRNIRFWELLRTFNIFRCGPQALDLRCFFEASWFLDTPEFDIIHVHFGPNAEKIGKLKARGFLKNTKLVATFHGFDLVLDRINEYPEAYQHIWKHFDLLTINTPYLEAILNKVPVAMPKIVVHPMGLDTYYFKPSSSLKPKTPFQLLFVGRLIPLKGVDLAIRAVAALKEKGYAVWLTIIGEGTLEKELESLAEHLGISESVRFLGAKTQEEVMVGMEKCHVLLMPGRPDPETGREETQGLVIQEAQAMGLPVIVSDAGGMHFGMQDQETGHVFRSEDIEELVRCIERLMENPEGYDQMCRNARDFAVKNYDYRILGQRLQEQYQQLLA